MGNDPEMFAHFSGEGPTLRQILSRCTKEEKRAFNSSSNVEEKENLSLRGMPKNHHQKGSEWFGQSPRASQRDQQIEVCRTRWDNMTWICHKALQQSPDSKSLLEVNLPLTQGPQRVILLFLFNLVPILAVNTTKRSGVGGASHSKKQKANSGLVSVAELWW